MMSQHVSSRTLPSFKELYASADALREPVGVAVAGGDDPTVLAAAAEGIRRGWIRPLLCGDASRVRALAAEQGIELSGCTIIDAEQPAVAAVECIHRGEARLLMKGQIATPDLMKAVLNRETGLRTERVICQMVLMEIPRDQRVFLLTDTGITIAPTLEQKTDLIRHLVETARLLGCPEPPCGDVGHGESQCGVARYTRCGIPDEGGAAGAQGAARFRGRFRLIWPITEEPGIRNGSRIR
ncbi:MAG: phosphate acyltransferase [Planctomycetaceae bacterium]